MATPTPWFSEEAGFFGDRFLIEYARWITPERTVQQVDFLTAAFGNPRARGRVLDLACGNGRHALGLARRGFEVTALDLNRKLLDLCRAEPVERNGSLHRIQADMRSLPFGRAFGAVVCMFTSFGFFPDGENALVLREVADVVEPRGLLVLDLLNPNFVLPRFAPYSESTDSGGRVWIHERRYDADTSRFVHKRVRIDDGREWETEVRLYSRNEIGSELHRSGFEVTVATGGYRFETPDLDHPRMILIAERTT